MFEYMVDYDIETEQYYVTIYDNGMKVCDYYETNMVDGNFFAGFDTVLSEEHDG